MIDLNAVHALGGAEFALQFPPRARLASFGIVPNAMTIRTEGTDAWTPVVLDADGTTQLATLWIFLKINGQWCAAGAERLRPSQVNGVKPVAEPGAGGLSTLVGNGWLYDANRWHEMAGYNPKPGEAVGVCVVAGSTRSDDRTPTRERTQVVVVEWPGEAGANPMRVLWEEGQAGSEPTPAPEPVPASQPPAGEPAAPSAYVPPSLDLSPLLEALTRIAVAAEDGAESQRRTEAAIVGLVRLLS